MSFSKIGFASVSFGLAMSISLSASAQNATNGNGILQQQANPVSGASKNSDCSPTSGASDYAPVAQQGTNPPVTVVDPAFALSQAACAKASIKGSGNSTNSNKVQGGSVGNIAPTLKSTLTGGKQSQKTNFDNVGSGNPVTTTTTIQGENTLTNVEGNNGLTQLNSNSLNFGYKAEVTVCAASVTVNNQGAVVPFQVSLYSGRNGLGASIPLVYQKEDGAILSRANLDAALGAVIAGVGKNCGNNSTGALTTINNGSSSISGAGAAQAQQQKLQVQGTKGRLN